MPKGYCKETGRSVRFKDRAGQRNGRLTFIRTLGEDAHRHQLWEAICDCGTTTRTATPHLTKSCGCLHRETAAKTQRDKAMPEDERRRRARANQLRQRARRKSDPLVAMQARLSRLHRHALAQVGAIKTSATFDALGYSPGDLVRHIERQFQSGVSWENMHAWQLDHVLPASGARSAADVIALNQLANLRPMWAAENNRKKANRLTLL